MHRPAGQLSKLSRPARRHGDKAIPFDRETCRVYAQSFFRLGLDREEECNATLIPKEFFSETRLNHLISQIENETCVVCRGSRSPAKRNLSDGRAKHRERPNRYRIPGRHEQRRIVGALGGVERRRNSAGKKAGDSS
jgi:hypothetical protein